jgi:hypothetical protein
VGGTTGGIEIKVSSNAYLADIPSSGYF